MVPNTWSRAAQFLNRFGLPKPVTTDDVSLAIADGSLLASLLSRYYPDEIDITKLTLPASTLHSKMHNWTVLNESLSCPLENQQLLSLASGSDDPDAIDALLDRLYQMLPDEGQCPSHMESNQRTDDGLSTSASTSAATTRLLLEAINVCEGSVQLLSERADLLSNVLRELKELHNNANVGNNPFDLLLSASQKKVKKSAKSNKRDISAERVASLKPPKKSSNRTSENVKPKVTNAKPVKPVGKLKKRSSIVNAS